MAWLCHARVLSCSSCVALLNSGLCFLAASLCSLWIESEGWLMWLYMLLYGVLFYVRAQEGATSKAQTLPGWSASWNFFAAWTDRDRCQQTTCRQASQSFFPVKPGQKNDVAWQAVEYNSSIHTKLGKLSRISAQMYKYHFSKPLGRCYRLGRWNLFNGRGLCMKQGQVPPRGGKGLK